MLAVARSDILNLMLSVMIFAFCNKKLAFLVNTYLAAYLCSSDSTGSKFVFFLFICVNSTMLAELLLVGACLMGLHSQVHMWWPARLVSVTFVLSLRVRNTNWVTVEWWVDKQSRRCGCCLRDAEEGERMYMWDGDICDRCIARHANMV